MTTLFHDVLIKLKKNTRVKIKRLRKKDIPKGVVGVGFSKNFPLPSLHTHTNSKNNKIPMTI